jgi:hypothetical protein
MHTRRNFEQSAPFSSLNPLTAHTAGVGFFFMLYHCMAARLENLGRHSSLGFSLGKHETVRL